MLVISRLVEETIVLNVRVPGRYTVRVLEIAGKKVKIGVDAPRDNVDINRGEVQRRIDEEGKQ